MLSSEVTAGALVRFHWKNKSVRAQNNGDVIRRAHALNGQVAVIMDAPFWPNGTRALIQSLNDPNLTLAVKWKYLETVEPIKINVFHAQNDTSLTNDYHQKEKEVLDKEDHIMVMTVHPDTAQYARCSIAHRVVPQNMEEVYLNDLDWFMADNDILDVDGAITRLKDSTKTMVSRIIWDQYQRMGSSDQIDKLIKIDSRFKTILKIQMRAVSQQNAYRTMDWLRNENIGITFIVQSFLYLYGMMHADLTIISRRVFAFATSSESIQLDELIAKLHRDFQELDATHPLSIAVIQFVISLVNQDLSPQQYHSILAGLRDVPLQLRHRLQRIRQMEMYCNVAREFDKIYDGFPQGASIAIVVPGDLIPEIDRFSLWLRRVIRMMKWNDKCDLYFYNI